MAEEKSIIWADSTGGEHVKTQPAEKGVIWADTTAGDGVIWVDTTGGTHVKSAGSSNTSDRK